MALLSLALLVDAMSDISWLPPALVVPLAGFAQGLVHAVGPDHCAAMATLNGMGGRASRARTFSTALRFAVGHTVVLGGMAAACLSAGVMLSETFANRAEVFGGAVLVALAVTALFLPSSVRHGHPHLPGHAHDHGHTHTRASGAAGALMAVSGVRSLLLAMTPLLVGGRFSLQAWTYLPAFALGILVGMGAVGLLLAEGMSRLSARMSTWVERAVYAGSAALGVVWIVTRL
jgi:nickel/cobalt transporter (NicO) family protein